MHIALVDDEAAQTSYVEGLINRYSEEHSVPLRVSKFNNVVNFLETYSAAYDIIFMDVKMPLLNGIDAARALRKKDQSVILFFLTSMEEYALYGYEVEAMDYILKPVSYFDFALRFTRALKKLVRKTDSFILIKTEAGAARVAASSIKYVEVSGHYCVYHTQSGEYRQYYSLKKLETELRDSGFALCNSFLLVNLAYVDRIDGMDAVVGGERLPISHPKKKAFTAQFAEFSTRGGRHD